MTSRLQPPAGLATVQVAADGPRFRTDFAWEFLRRNRLYRLSARRAQARGDPEEAAAKPWGLLFLADPALGAPDAPVFWRPEAAPSHVICLQAASPAQGEPMDLRAGVQAERRSLDGLHLRFRCGLQGYVRDGDISRPLAAVLPISGRFSAALHAASALERQLRGEPPLLDLTDQQRTRLARTLLALDAAEARLTYREIARDLFGQEAVDRHAWRTSSVRDTVIRLVRSGRELVAGGYRRLLLKGEPSAPGRPQSRAAKQR